MKLKLEIDLDREILFSLDSTKEQQIKSLQRKFIERINELILNAQLDDSKYERFTNKHPFHGLGELKLIDFEI